MRAADFPITFIIANAIFEMVKLCENRYIDVSAYWVRVRRVHHEVSFVHGRMLCSAWEVSGS